MIGVNSFKGEGEGLNYAVAAKDVREFLAATGSVIVKATCAEAKLLFQGRSADNTAFMRQYSLRCDDTVDLTIVEPYNEKEPFYALWDSQRRGKIDAIFLNQSRTRRWQVSYWDVDFDETFRLVGLHRNGEWQPYEYQNRCSGKALPDFKCA